MTRPSKRDIEKAVEDLRDDADAAAEVVESQVVTVTEDDVDETGSADVPVGDPPQGYTRGRVVSTQHEAVVVHELTPCDDGGG